MDTVDDRLRQPLAGVVGVDRLDERRLDGVRHLLIAAADPRAERPPDQPEGRVAHAVGPHLVKAALMVVEVAGLGLVAKPDVDAQVRRGEHIAVARAHDLELLAEQPERRDREDLVGVEGAVVRGDRASCRR